MPVSTQDTQLSREESERLAAAIASVDPEDPESYFAILGKRLREQNVDLPCVRISYTGVNQVVEATSSAGALPSLPNVLLYAFKVCASRFCLSDIPRGNWSLTLHRGHLLTSSCSTLKAPIRYTS